MIEQAIDDLMTLLPIEGAPGKEATVAQVLRHHLIEIGVPEENIRHDNAQSQSEYGGEVGNLIVEIDGNQPAPRLMFSTHMDTVPDAVGCRPRPRYGRQPDRQRCAGPCARRRQPAGLRDPAGVRPAVGAA